MNRDSKIGIDIVGFGPIGRDLARKLVTFGRGFYVASISDSSATIYPKNSAQVLKIVKWKEESKSRKLSDSGSSLGLDTQAGDWSDSAAEVAVEVTNSNYSQPEQAKKRAFAALKAGKHLVSASKVALSSDFFGIQRYSRKKGVHLGFGATICGARHALRVAQSLVPGEIESACAVLNASTTFILSKLENPKTTFDQACEEASKAGILESDWSIDLEGVDAAAKTAIVSNVLFPEIRTTISEVRRKGISGEESMDLISKARSKSHCVRLVSQIEENGEKAYVGPRALPPDSPLAVEGRFNAVSFSTRNLGEISLRNLGGGVSLTSSILLSDILEAARFRA